MGFGLGIAISLVVSNRARNEASPTRAPMLRLSAECVRREINSKAISDATVRIDFQSGFAKAPNTDSPLRIGFGWDHETAEQWLFDQGRSNVGVCCESPGADDLRELAWRDQLGRPNEIFSALAFPRNGKLSGNFKLVATSQTARLDPRISIALFDVDGSFVIDREVIPRCA